MESIAELRKICQTTAKNDVSNVYMRYISRFFSIYLTRLILPFPVSPNQVSFAMIVTGVLATFLFLSVSKGAFLAGAFLLQLWYILDCMDGEVARYRQYQQSKTVITDKRQSGMTGSYYDVINHYIINHLVPAMIGIGLTRMTGNLFYAVLGILGSLGQVLTLAMHDGIHRLTVAKIKKCTSLQVNKSETQKLEGEKGRGFSHTVFMILHYTMTYPSVMNLVTLAALFNFFIPIVEWRFFLLWYLTLGSCIVSAVIVARNILHCIPDQDFQKDFTTL
jgi:hypothetical protein